MPKNENEEKEEVDKSAEVDACGGADGKRQKQ